MLNCVGVAGRGEREMCFMEGQGVDGHVGDESSPYRNTFVSVFEYVSLFRLKYRIVPWCPGCTKIREKRRNQGFEKREWKKSILRVEGR